MADVVETLNLKEVAQRLGVHYMTAYRYVRLGRLPAEREGTGWRVREDDLAAFVSSGGGDPADRPRAGGMVAGDGGSSAVDWTGRLVERLLAGDEPGAWSVVEGALVAGFTPQACYLELVVGALGRISQGAGADVPTWHSFAGIERKRNADSEAASGSAGFDVASSYVATATAVRVVARLGARFRKPGRTRGTVVLGSPRGEQHSLPITIVADLVRLAGFGVLELGPDVPAEAFVAAATRVERLVAVGIGVTRVDALTEAADVVAAVRRVLPDVPVLVGGQAVRNPEMAALTGATGWAEDGAGLVAALEDLIKTRRPRPQPAQDTEPAEPSAHLHLAP
ncbi:MAG: helix-turn-helix domain-containing protein [Acidimicrobiia bacterium]